MNKAEKRCLRQAVRRASRLGQRTFATQEAQKSKVEDFGHTNVSQTREIRWFRESKVADFCNIWDERGGATRWAAKCS
jgi:hypothetical protein